MSGTKPLPEKFFYQDVKVVAQELLGKTLCVRQNQGAIIKDIISETEAYDGENDLACHASKGKPPRTSIMYEQGGVCYVYLCYGMHWMLNFVTGSPEYPAAVLIRGSLGVNGPGRLTKHFGIDGSFNKKLLKSDTDERIKLRRPISCFLYYMNKRAKKLGMYNTKYANPHGLMNKNNVSTAEDMVKLCIECWKNQVFRKVCGT